ncbi:hypothetical protein DMB66_57355 [Actinoplanes sp. ATCC 53533]|uniref:hypothetical protein n=1 Tax=Actinoplanes sp. ATCC 53533 TaxID=1288362 RepID=UPI000F78F578|nr:hypothetical protein [Actinoplanes sp. ATCC 53533]RSM40291.1 hypothetical protein DMB66_57355 [Actinoplanes sp. ATCC 53533]
MTTNDHPTERFRAPGLDEPTIVDVYPATSQPLAPGTGGPPEWTPPAGTDQATAQPPGAGKPRVKIAVAGAIVAAVVATAGITAAVLGTNDGGSAATTGGPPGATGQGFAGAGGQGSTGGQAPGGGQAPTGGGRGGGLGGGGGTAAALHGTYVVSDGNGGYVTQESQTGTVSAVSATSITVKSVDGYSKTYVVGTSTTVDNGADQIADVATGHTVRVVATVSGNTATATTVTDTNLATTTQQGGTQQGGTQQGGTQQGGVPGGGGPMQGGTQQQGTQPGTTTQDGAATGT